MSGRNEPDEVEWSLMRIANSLEAIETHLADLKAQPQGAHAPLPHEAGFNADPSCEKCGGTGVVTVGDGDEGGGSHEEPCPNYSHVPF